MYSSHLFLSDSGVFVNEHCVISAILQLVLTRFRRCPLPSHQEEEGSQTRHFFFETLTKDHF